MFAFPRQHFIRFLWLCYRAFLGSKKEKVSTKAQVACYSKSKKKNQSLFLSEDVRRCKRRSKKEICLGFSATTVLVRKHGSQSI